MPRLRSLAITLLIIPEGIYIMPKPENLWLGTDFLRIEVRARVREYRWTHKLFCIFHIVTLEKQEMQFNQCYKRGLGG